MEKIKNVLVNECPKVCYCLRKGDKVVTDIVKCILKEYAVDKAAEMLLIVESSLTI